ncbi:MAG: membrane protein insertion efficiency factor YidD [Candidatus Gracilibacteria bacterium]|nr:membrane protein insertion efficiency factor YidD [Candidatus Gracilibacteria bacterium]
MLKKIIIYILKLYQKYLSLDHSIWVKMLNKPPYCKHIPSCSDYMIESIEKKGLAKGLAKGTYRVLRCNPWTKGGYDPVDKK